MNEREQFEAWVSASGRAHMLERESPHGWYKDLSVTAWWTAWQASRRAALEEAAQLCAKRSERAGTMGRAIEAIDLALAIRALATGDTNNG